MLDNSGLKAVGNTLNVGLHKQDSSDSAGVKTTLVATKCYLSAMALCDNYVAYQLLCVICGNHGSVSYHLPYDHTPSSRTSAIFTNSLIRL